jgi:hypothetical protein
MCLLLLTVPSNLYRISGTPAYINVNFTSFPCRIFTIKYYQSDQIKEDVIGGAWSTYGLKRNTYSVLMRKPKKRDRGNPDVNKRILLKLGFKKQFWRSLD